MSQNKSDTISINRLALETFIGCFPEEQKRKQPLFVTVTLGCDTAEAGRTDDLTKTIDYDALSQIIRAEIESHSYRLIEAVAETIADLCLQIPRAAWADVTVEKPTALQDAASASVTIHRTHHQ